MKTMKFSLEKQQVCCEICHAVLRGALKKVWKKETMFQRESPLFFSFYLSHLVGSAPTPKPA